MSITSPIDPSMHGVIWTKSLQEKVEERPQIADDEVADLVVVGGGYCGLTTALHAAKAGLSVVLLEAGIVGDGASGRNGGFVVPHFPGGLTPSRVASVLGRQKGEKLAGLVAGGAEAMFGQVREFQIQCHAEQKGWIQPAHSQKSLAAVRSVYDEWRALGVSAQWLDGGDVAALTGAKGYVGGWTNPSGGTINPYSHSLGLARVATNLGVRIFEHSRAERFEIGKGGTTVHVGGHRVRGRTVLVATNGYTDATLPTVQRSAIPVYLFHAATKPLRKELRETILSSRICFTDLRNSGGFGRLDPDGRLITGGAVLAVGNSQAYGLAHVRKRSRILYPAMTDEDVAIEGYWEGFCAITPTYLPHVQILGDGFLSVGGFSTRGVNLAQSIGRVMGEFASGRRSIDDIPLEVRDARRDVPMWPVKTLIARFMFPLFQAKDRLGLT
jgi:glycine/D-amino acid oxidase-like deaminating enzyme